MKNFNQYMEALLVAVKPQSDSVGQVSPCDAGAEPEMPKDMMSAAADDVLRNLGIQTDDDVGEMGEIQSDGEMTEGEEGGVSLECLGEEGLKVNFNGMQIVLPRNVVDMIKGFEPSEENAEGAENEQSEGEESEENESEEHEAAESPEFEAGEEEEEKEESDEEEVKESVVFKLKRKPSTDEWVVAAYVDGKFNENKSYYTNDKKDAEATLAKMTQLGESKKWIQKAVNPKHEGFCTPMTKKTCTPRRKALAKRFKKGIENEG